MLFSQTFALPLLLNIWTAEAAPRLIESELPVTSDPTIVPVISPPTPTSTAQYFAITDADVFGGQTIQVMLPAAVTNTAQLGGGSFPGDVYKQYVQQSLPFLLQQLNLSDAQVRANVGDPVAFLTGGLLSAISNGNFSDSGGLLNSRDLEERSLIGDWLIGFKCGFFAAGTLPGYLLAEQAFRLINLAQAPGPSSYSEEFYFRPQYGDLSRSQSIGFHRDANFPPGFNAIAATFGRNIYIRPGYNQAIWAPHSLSNPYQAAFQASIRLLLHEMKHIKQESETSFIPAIFGYRYLFEYCKAGFSYSGNRFEKEAVAMEHVDDHLLIQKPLFQGFWRDTKLYSQIGYPTTVNTGRGPNYDTLSFDYGSVEIHDNGNCWRSYTTPELAILSQTGPKPWSQREPTGPAC